jgi:hypothetical protein
MKKTTTKFVPATSAMAEEATPKSSKAKKGFMAISAIAVLVLTAKTVLHRRA